MGLQSYLFIGLLALASCQQPGASLPSCSAACANVAAICGDAGPCLAVCNDAQTKGITNLPLAGIAAAKTKDEIRKLGGLTCP